MAVDKLVDSAVLDAGLSLVANAIRSKGGTTGKLAFPNGMVTAINSIPTGYEDVWLRRKLSGSYINNTISSIYIGQFCGMRDLTYVRLDNCVSAPEYAFSQCASLASVSMGTCSVVADYAFGYCHKLSSIYLPLCQSIGHMAFVNCDSLTSVSMNLVRTVGSWAFYQCSRISTVTLNNVSYIYTPYAFGGCTSLTTVRFSKLSTLYADDTFNNCTNLKYVYLMSTSLMSITGASKFFQSVASIYVPTSLLQAYKTSYSSVASKFVGS